MDNFRRRPLTTAPNLPPARAEHPFGVSLVPKFGKFSSHFLIWSENFSINFDEFEESDLVIGEIELATIFLTDTVTHGVLE
jgi:hypothetical protein